LLRHSGPDTDQMANTDPSEQSRPFLDDFEARWLLRTMRRHGAVIAVAVVLGALIGAIFHGASPIRYRASAVILVNLQTLKLGLEDVPLEVELVRPTRRLVGTVCESDLAMSLLAAELQGQATDPSEMDIDQMLDLVFKGEAPEGRQADLRQRLYFDQRGMEMAALRVIDSDPKEAARIANAWARVSRELLRKAYGTSPRQIRDIEKRIGQTRQEVLAKATALERLSPDEAIANRMEASSDLELAQQILTALNARYALLQVRLEDSKQIVKIITPAAPPASPTNPSARLVIGLFALVGFLVGLVLAMLRGPGCSEGGVPA